MADLYRYRQILFTFLRKKISFVRIRLTSHGKLSRLRDTKLIQDIPQILKEMSNELGGPIIYRLPEEILMVTIPADAIEIAKKAEKVLGVRTNYFFEVTISSTILSNKDFLHKYNKLFGAYEKNLYPELPTEIRAVPDNEASHRALICDLCQMAPAVKIYPREIYPESPMIEPVEEFLCEGCLKLREEASRAGKLAKWEDEEEAKVAFFKINLQMGELVDFLKHMFADDLGFQRLLDEDLGFSIIKEFLEDYQTFLNLFEETVMSHADYGAEHNHESILRNLFCVKIKKENEIKLLVREYVEIFRSQRFFSKFVYFAEKKKQSLPVKLSVTTSNVKYPFMEHWYVLNNPQDSINLYAIPHTKLQTSFEKYSYLMDIRLEDSRISSALHRLSEIEARTKNQFLLMAAMVEMKNDLRDLARHLITTKELSLKEALSYYKLMGN